MNQARNMTAGNTLLMRIASNLYMKMAAPGSPFHCNTKIKVTLAELASPTNGQPFLCDQALFVSCIVTTQSLQVKALEFTAFVVRA